jgi:hypothetical protein
MTIDFTKPIRYKTTHGLIKVLFHDDNGVYYEFPVPDDEIENRSHMDLFVFNSNFENVPVEPRKFKAYIGLNKLNGMDRVESSLNKKILEDNNFEQIQEVEFISGEGNN